MDSIFISYRRQDSAAHAGRLYDRLTAHFDAAKIFLDIDSIDVLELVLMMEKDYSVVVNNKELGAKVFSSLRAMANYIREKAPAMSG